MKGKNITTVLPYNISVLCQYVLKRPLPHYFQVDFFFFHISILLHFTFSLQKLRRVTHHRTQAIKQTPSGDAYNLLDMLDYLISVDNSIITTTY